MSAVVQVAGLLRPRDPVNLEGSYLDVLGGAEPIGLRRGGQAFRNRARPRKEERVALEALDVQESDQVIDVGCGLGSCTRLLARRAGEGLTIGVDASAAMVAAAARNGERDNLAYLRGDARALPFEDESFDVACSLGAIQALDEPLRALDEMVRVLAPGGRMAVLLGGSRRERRRRARAGLPVLGGEELIGALRAHGLVDLGRRAVRRGQFVWARKPGEEVGNGR